MKMAARCMVWALAAPLLLLPTSASANYGTEFDMNPSVAGGGNWHVLVSEVATGSHYDVFQVAIQANLNEPEGGGSTYEPNVDAEAMNIGFSNVSGSMTITSATFGDFWNAASYSVAGDTDVGTNGHEYDKLVGIPTGVEYWAPTGINTIAVDWSSRNSGSSTYPNSASLSRFGSNFLVGYVTVDTSGGEALKVSASGSDTFDSWSGLNNDLSSNGPAPVVPEAASCALLLPALLPIGVALRCKNRPFRSVWSWSAGARIP